MLNLLVLFVSRTLTRIYTYYINNQIIYIENAQQTGLNLLQVSLYDNSETIFCILWV